MTVVLSTIATVESGASIITQLLGIAAMAVVPATLAAVAYRAAFEDRIPPWLAITAGIAVVALYLGTTPALEVLFDETVPSQLSTALFNVAALVLAAGGGALGREVGDRFGAEVLAWQPTHETGEGVSQLARAVGQVTTVSLPETIEDTPGYDPAPQRTKTELAGSQFVFPRGLTVDELDERISEQLRSDYGIGVTDIRFDDYGDIESLAVGTRAAGIGATLPPATNAVAVRADPGFSASTGDVVQVWEPDSMQRVCTGELRGVADDVVTIAIDAADTPKVDPTRRYRLVTLPVDDRPDREFASLLRAAEETFSTATVEAGSPLHGQPVGALDTTLVAIRPEDGDPVPFPDSEYRLAPGDLLFVIATPGNLRRLETGATALDPTVASTPSLSTDETEPAEGIQTAEPTATAREEPTGADGLPAGDEQAEASTAGQSDTSTTGNAGSESFQEIKANFEESDQPTDESEPETAEAATNGDSASFDELKSEFESGNADWEDDGQPSDPETEASTEFPDSDDIDIAFADEEAPDDGDETDNSEDSGNGLVSLEEADISFDDDDDAGEPDAEETDDFGDIDIDDDLQGDGDDTISDDIGDLEFEDNTEDVSELDLSDDEGAFATDDEDSDADDDEEEGEDDDEDDSGGGGGSSFAQLKEEFESGDADWEDDVSDSPGGDMRLDE